MFTVQRIYAYRPDPEQTAVFIDRLYPRGIRKARARARRAALSALARPEGPPGWFDP